MEVQPVHLGQGHDHAKRTAARDDRRLIDRVGLVQRQPDNGVASLVIGGFFLLLGRQDHAAAFDAQHDLVLGIFKVFHGHEAASDTGGGQRGLIHQVHQVSAREARRAPRDDAQVDIGALRDLLGVDAQDLLAALDVRVRDVDLAVKTAGAQQCGVQHVLAVGGGDDDDAFVGVKAVHFHQKLVQRLLALVIAAADADAARASHRVDFVDEDDAGCRFLGLFEHVAHPACTDTHEHFDEIRTRDGKEGHARLARNCTREQGFTGAGRADQQRAFGDLAAKAAEFLRITQEFDDLFQLFLGFVDAGHVVKGHAAMLFGQHFRARLAKAHGPAFATARHPVHEEDPDPDQQDKGQPDAQQGHEARLLLAFDLDLDPVGDQPVGDFLALRTNGRV